MAREKEKFVLRVMPEDTALAIDMLVPEAAVVPWAG
jgi:hypothetical protein